MTQVRLTMPNGDSITAPDGALLASLLTEPQKYFTPDSCGEAAIEYNGNDIATSLGIRHVRPAGFSIEWMMSTGPEVDDSASIVLSRPPDEKTAETHVGGMPLHVPEASVISDEQALAVISAFCESGRVPPAWNVVRLSQLTAKAYFWGDQPG